MENPFSLSPNPRYCYLTALHQAAVAKINYVINNRQGLCTLIADIGHGKTTVMRYIFDQLQDRSDITTRLMTHPQFATEMAFLKAICMEFGLEPKRSKLEQLNQLQAFLVAEFQAGRTVILLIDESQLLVGLQFELIRQLLNFETNTTKLITIIMAGQPELKGKLKLKRALASRIAVNSTLDSLPPDDTREMIHYRLMVAKAKPDLFPAETCHAIYQKTLGVPREVVKICGLAMDLVKLHKLDRAEPELIEACAGEVAVS